MNINTVRTPRIRFEGFSDEWVETKISDVVGYEASKHTAKEVIVDGNYPLFDASKQIGCITDYDQEETYISITKDGTIGRLAVQQAKTSILATMGYLLPKQNLNFAYALLQKIDFNQFAMGTTIQHIYFKDYGEYLVLAPSSAEQELIGQFFKALDRQIANQAKQLDILKQLKKGYLQQMFPREGELVPRIRFKGFSNDWVEKRLGEVGRVEMCRRVFKEETTTLGDIPFYKIGTFGQQPDAYITKELFDDYKHKYPYPSKGDILISASGTIGRIVVYDGEEAYFQDSNIVWLNINKDLICNPFLQQVYNVVRWEGLEGTTIKRLYNADILSTLFKSPTLPEQQLIGQFFANIDRQITNQAKQLDILKQLKKGYLQQMFV